MAQRNLVSSDYENHSHDKYFSTSSSVTFNSLDFLSSINSLNPKDISIGHDDEASFSSVSVSNASAIVQKTNTGRNPVPLYLTCNDNHMSPYQCMIRKQIEYFEADDNDTNTTKHGRIRQILPGQVGIRCRHCSIRRIHRQVVGAVHYPTKLNGIYQLCQNMAILHFMGNCTSIPSGLRQEMIRLRDERHITPRNNDEWGSGKRGWAETAISMGIFEDEVGNVLRFDPLWTKKVLHTTQELVNPLSSESNSRKMANTFTDDERYLEL